MRVELRGVTKRFGRLEALRAITLTLEAGKRAALIGPNGSGKSTLTRVVMGLLSYEGQVLFDGKPATNRLAFTPRLAYVPQIPPQLSAPVQDVVAAIARVRGLDPEVIVTLAERLELDLPSITARPFRQLSGGMKQKLLISVALAAPASLVILDEPTASLDPRSRQLFLALFAEIAAGATVLLSSHRLEEVRHLVDHIVALDEGVVAFDGPADTYLGRQALSLIEVRVPQANGTADRLSALGFQPALAGWWVRRVTRAEKMALLPQLSAELGEKLDNVIVRELESIDTTGEAR